MITVPRSDRARGWTTYGALILLGFFTTSLASPQKLGAIPLQSWIKNDLGLSAVAMSAFFAVARIPWYIKPVAGVVSDRVRLLGTRRRHYLLFATLAGAGLWLLAAILPRRYYPLMIMAVALNAMPMLANTVLGGLLVDVGRREGAMGRLSALRVTAMNAASLTASLVGGFLATRALTLTCGISAAILLVMALAVGLLLHEPPAAPRTQQAPGEQLRKIVSKLRSRPLLAALAFTFLYYLAPSPDMVLYYYRTKDLQFSNPEVGLLDTLQCAGGMLGALSYTWLCRRVKLRTLLPIGVALKACAALLYFAYRSRVTALALEGVIGFVTLLSLMPVQEVAARAAPPDDEALCFSIVLSIGNLAIGLSSLTGSALYERCHLSLFQIVSIEAAVTVCVLLFLPLLPRSLTEEQPEGPAGSAP